MPSATESVAKLPKACGKNGNFHESIQALTRLFLCNMFRGSFCGSSYIQIYFIDRISKSDDIEPTGGESTRLVNRHSLGNAKGESLEINFVMIQCGFLCFVCELLLEIFDRRLHFLQSVF